jgi:hypothetical protein
VRVLVGITMNKKLPYDLSKEEIAELLKRKKEISDYVMKEFNREKFLTSGKPHTFKMTLDDGWAKYEYDLNLTENWSMQDIHVELEKILKRYNCSIGIGELCGAGYLENEKENN